MHSYSPDAPNLAYTGAAGIHGADDKTPAGRISGVTRAINQSDRELDRLSALVESYEESLPGLFGPVLRPDVELDTPAPNPNYTPEGGEATLDSPVADAIDRHARTLAKACGRLDRLLAALRERADV